MRVHNFGAGPCTLPLEVLEEAREEFLDYAGTGMSIIEMSHRSPEYEALHHRCLELARHSSGAPDDFAVILVQGGASLQFSMVPINLLGPGKRAGYVLSGAWARKAFQHASSLGSTYTAWDGATTGYTSMPSPNDVEVRPESAYLHITTNETIGGIRMVDLPETEVPLVADMSSEFLARPIAWDRYDVVYGGVQKNLAPAGLALVFVRESVLESAPEGASGYLAYRWHAEADSLANTPAMFSIYLMGKVLERLVVLGGVEALEQRSAAKAALLYEVIDNSGGFYSNPVDRRFRSHMNVVFRLADPDREKEFLAAADEAGLVGLKGHRSVGGCRASLYAGLELRSVEILVEFMQVFAADHG